MISPPKLSRTPLGRRGFLDFRSAKFGGVEILVWGTAAISQDLLVDSADIFAKTDLDLGKCNIIKHAIKITDPQPFTERYRRILPHLFDEVKKHLPEMIEVGAIRKSFSPWASAVVLVRKKDGGAEVLHQP